MPVIEQLTPSLPEVEMIRAKKEMTDEGEDLLEDFSDGLKALRGVPVHFFLPGLG